MKRLTKEEFESRLMEINNAERIFIHSGLTKNISVAFEIYQRILGETSHDVQINNVISAGRRGSELDGYNRPECPKCGKDMFIQVFRPGHHIKTRLICPDPSCPAYDSDKDLDEWKAILKRKGEQ